jgi:RimJ/RimL family protein N-acetyltransferase
MPERGTPEVHLRTALPEDGPALMEAVGRIDEETEFLGLPGEYRRWREGVEERLALMREKRSGAYLLAEAGGEIIGYLGGFAGFFRRAKGAIYIGHVGLRRAWRGRGIGTRLFIAFEDWARAEGAWRLELRVDEANERGQALYRKRGFTSEGRIADAVFLEGQAHAHLWMAKTLVPLAGPDWERLDPPPGRVDPGAVAFRALRPEEAPLLCRWERQLLAETPFHLKEAAEVLDEAAMAKALVEKNPDRLSLAACAGTGGGASVVGYGTVWKEPGQRMQHDCFCYAGVLRAHWSSGLGRALFERLERWAREQGARRLSANVLAHNARGLRFAAAQGFTVEVESPRFAVTDGRVVHRVRLGKRLNETA